MHIPSTWGLGKIQRFHKIGRTNASRPDQKAIWNISPIIENYLLGMHLFHNTSHKVNATLMDKF